MGRALRPTRRLRPSQVRAGDVVLVRSSAGSLRWMLVDYAVGFGKPHVWSGRWAFGGQWLTHVVHVDNVWITAKDRRDAKRDQQRLAALSRST